MHAVTGGGGARPALLALGAVLALGGAAFLGYQAFGRGEPPAATQGAHELDRVLPTAPPRRTDPISTVPGGDHLQLSRTGPRAATSATDPAAFQQLLSSDGPGWAAADGTISIPLADGKTLWLFGDTLVNLPGADGSLRRNADFVRNSAILHDGATATTLLTGTTQDAGDFLTPADPGEWYWPGHGIVEGDELIVFMGRVRTTAEGAPGWNFEGVGSDMLRLNLRDLSVTERIAMPGGRGTDWGSAVIEHDGHTYVYGFKGYEDDPYRRESIVARAKSGHLGDGDFEYWDGRGWTSDASKVAPVTDGVSNSYSVVRTPGGKFAMVSQELFFGTGLCVRTADAPQGPWSAWRMIDPGPDKLPNGISYNAQVHPTFTDDGSLLASWNMNRDDGQLPGPGELDGYRPVFKAIDADLLDR